MGEKQSNETCVFETTKMSFGAYLQLEGVKVVRILRGNKKDRKTVWIFQDTPGNNGQQTLCERLYPQYLNSRERRFDSIIRDMKRDL